MLSVFLKEGKSLITCQGFPGGSEGKESACNAGYMGSIPELGRSPGGGHQEMHSSHIAEAWLGEF